MKSIKKYCKTCIYWQGKGRHHWAACISIEDSIQIDSSKLSGMLYSVVKGSECEFYDNDVFQTFKNFSCCQWRDEPIKLRKLI